MAINYGKVIGRFLGMVEDGIDLDDDPDLVPLTGTVTFTPAVNKVLATQEDPPVQIFPQVVKATLDSQGYLTHNFKRGIKLLSPTGDVNPSGWTWRVSFDLRQGSNKVAAESFDIELPAYVPGPNVNDPDQESTAVDLALATPVDASPGNAIVKGDSVDSVSYDSANSSLVFTIGSNIESVPIPLPPVRGNIFIDEDGVPYFDSSNSGGLALSLDVDGVPYIND